MLNTKQPHYSAARKRSGRSRSADGFLRKSIQISDEAFASMEWKNIFPTYIKISKIHVIKFQTVKVTFKQMIQNNYSSFHIISKKEKHFCEFNLLIKQKSHSPILLFYFGIRSIYTNSVWCILTRNISNEGDTY